MWVGLSSRFRENVFSPLFQLQTCASTARGCKSGFCSGDVFLVLVFCFILCGSSKYFGGLDIAIGIVSGKLSNRLLPLSFCSSSDPLRWMHLLGECVADRREEFLQQVRAAACQENSYNLGIEKNSLCLQMVCNKALDFNDSLQFILLKVAEPVKNW